MDSAGDSSVYRIETDLLMRLTEPYKAILDSTETDVNTIHKKNEAWTHISKQYNINRSFKKKTCRELRKTYQRMVIKSRSKSLEMQVEEEKKPKLKKAKLSDSHEETTSMQGSSNDVNKDMPSVSYCGEKPAGHLLQRSVSNNKKKKKEKIVLPKTCMVIMRPISKAQLKAISRSPMKLLTTVSQKSPPRTKETSIPSSVSPYLKLAAKPGTQTCNADQNVGVLIKVENVNVTSAAIQSSVSNIVNQTKSDSGNTPSPRQPSSLSYSSPSRDRLASSSLALAGSNFSCTPGFTTLTTSMARTSTTTSVPVSSSESAFQPLSPENAAIQTVINTYSKIHPKVVCQTGDPSSPRAHIVKRIVWSPPVQHPRTTNSRTSDSEPTSLVSTSPKVENGKPGSVVPAITMAKVASCKPAALISSSTSPKVASCILPKIVPITTAHKAASSPKVTSCTTAKVVPTTSSSRIVSCKAANVVPVSTTTKVTSGQPGNFTTSSTSTTRCQTVNKLETSSVQKLARCQLVPTCQAVAFLSRTAARSRLIESVAALSQSSTAVASVESPPTAVTTAVTSAESSVGITCPALQTSQSFEEGQDEGISVTMAEPEILNIRMLEANLDVRAAQARVEAEEALREEALAKLAIVRAEMDHQALRQKIELRHMRRVNALALRHAKELHVAALALRSFSDMQKVVQVSRVSP